MAFFGNGAINRVNLHYGIHALAQASGGVFYSVFLLRAGVSVSSVLLVQAAIFAGRFVIRPIVLPLAKRWGLRPLLTFGTLLAAGQYPLLAHVHGVGGPLVALCILSSVGDVFYWTTYHAYFAAIGDAEHRGHQIGAREALAAGVGIIAPLIAGWALIAVGPVWTFYAVGLVQALSAVPLLGAPNITVSANAPGALRAAWLGVSLFACDGWMGGCYLIAWQLALFVTLKQNFAAYGGAMALSALVGAAGGLLLGRHVDGGGGRRAVLIAYGLASVVIILRAASLGLPWLAVAANAPGALIGALQAPAMMSAVYNKAQASPCPLRFHIATEGGWDVGFVCACLVASGLAAAGRPLSIAILLALPGVAVTILLLTRYYARLAGRP